MIDRAPPAGPSETTKLLLGGLGVLVVGGFVVAIATTAQRPADDADKLDLLGVPAPTPEPAPKPIPKLPVGGLAPKFTPMTARPARSARPIRASAFGYAFYRAHLQSAVAGRLMTAAKAQQLLAARRGEFLAAGVTSPELPTTLFKVT